MADLRRADQRTVIRERPTRQHVADNTAFVDIGIANLGVWFFVHCVITGDNFDVMVFEFLNNISHITSISTLLKLLFLLRSVPVLRLLPSRSKKHKFKVQLLGNVAGISC